MNLKNSYRKEQFNPGVLGLFFNPFWAYRFLLYKYFEQIIPKTTFNTVLDLGCGSKPYQHLFTCEEYIGIDIENPGHCHKNEAVDVYYDGLTLPFPDESIDLIFSSEVFEHIEKIDDIIIEIKRVLKPQGCLIVSAPFCWDEHEMPHDYRRFTAIGLEILLKRNGFQIEESLKVGNDQLVVFQLFMLQIYYKLPTNKYLRLILTVVLFFPLNLVSLFLIKSDPKSKLYFTTVAKFRNE